MRCDCAILNDPAVLNWTVCLPHLFIDFVFSWQKKTNKFTGALPSSLFYVRSRNVHFWLCKNFPCFRPNLRKTVKIDVFYNKFIEFQNWVSRLWPDRKNNILEAMTVYMGKPRRRMDSILKWEYFYYDCLVLPRKNKVSRNHHLPDENIFWRSLGFDILHDYKNITN